MSGTMKLRTASRLIVLILVIVLAGVLALRQHIATTHAGPNATPTTHPTAALTAGTVLGGKSATPFQLADQNGSVISLAALRGHPVVLTFLDATCTSECPITAQYLGWTAQALGSKAASVAWLAMSVNPQNTPADGRQFIAKNKVTIPIHILLGTHAQLARLWHAYGIYVQPVPGGDTIHTIVTYLIDEQGQTREVLDQAYDPRQAAHDLGVLLAQSS